MEAISHAAGLIGFNSKYSEVIVDCPVETDIRGKLTSYSYLGVADTSNVKYYLVTGTRLWGFLWNNGS